MGGKMRIKISGFSTAMLLAMMIFSLVVNGKVLAAKRFISHYPCKISSKSCNDTQGRIVDGVFVQLPCWEYNYNRACEYPSKNDCQLFEHCYALGDRQCLLKDHLGFCVNMQKEFSCKSWEIENREQQMVRVGLEAKEGRDGLICKGMPCMDGNCVDKSYESNGQMMDSLSKLAVASKLAPDKNGNISLFAGSSQYCEKKPIGYSNCCRDDLGGWGHDILGAKCTKDELQLMHNRQQNLCVYVGKSSSKKLGVTTNIRHNYCCFGSVLNKVVQIGARGQLGRNFGTSNHPDCSGLTLEQIMRINWENLDLSEVIDDLRKKLLQNRKNPSTNELETLANRAKSKLNSHFNQQQKRDPNNKRLGINKDLKEEE
jgi:hypothetical protein